jgi:similar to spore coat protein
MNPIIENLTGMNALSDQVVAMDLLISAKSGVRNYAMAVTETGTPEIKDMLTRHLMEALDMHEQISSFMAEKGWYQNDLYLRFPSFCNHHFLLQLQI